MIKILLRKILRHLALEHGHGIELWRKHCNPVGEDWALYLKRHGGLTRMGEFCSIQNDAKITDVKYLSMGNNVRLSGVSIFGHDGSANMINRMCNLRLEKVGKVVLHDDVFIGYGTIVMPNVSIGPRSIVAAGSVVRHDVAPDSVYAGNPAKRICSIDEHIASAIRKSSSYPWKELLDKRKAVAKEISADEIENIRIQSFFGGASTESNGCSTQTGECA